MTEPNVSEDYEPFPIKTVGDLRRALEPWSDDCRLLEPMSFDFHLDLVHGSALEVCTPPLDTNVVLGAPRSPDADAALKETMRKIGQRSSIRPMPDPYRTDNAGAQA